MVLTREQFRNSFFYPAAGCDLNPLLRFSDLTDTFVYPNLGLTEEETLKYMDSELWRYKGILEAENLDRKFTKDELDYYKNTDDVYSAFENKREIDDYENLFNKYLRTPFWGRELIFNRVSGGIKRKLRVIYFSDEGMRAYIGLSRKGIFVPKYLCTIQSGELEEPEGVMERLMENYETYPDIWIRGFQYKKGYFHKNFTGKYLYRNDSLMCKGIFNKKIQSYGKWFANPTYQSKNIFNFNRHVSAFCREGFEPNVIDYKIIKSQNSEIKINRKPLVVQDFKNYDAVFTTNNLLKKINKQTGTKDNTVLWDEIINNESYIYPDISKFMEFLENKCIKNNYKNVLMTLVGYEDAGDYLQEWIEKNRDLSIIIEIRIISLMDLYFLMKK